MLLIPIDRLAASYQLLDFRLGVRPEVFLLIADNLSARADCVFTFLFDNFFLH